MGGAFYEGVAGTIRQRGNRWQVDTTIDGRRIRKAAPTRAEAETLLAELSRGNLSGTKALAEPTRQRPNLTVAAMIDSAQPYPAD